MRSLLSRRPRSEAPRRPARGAPGDDPRSDPDGHSRATGATAGAGDPRRPSSGRHLIRSDPRLRLSAVRTCSVPIRSSPSRSATVRATRKTRKRPRALSAPAAYARASTCSARGSSSTWRASSRMSSCALQLGPESARRACWRSRASATRLLAAADEVDGGARRSASEGRSTVTSRSMRSSRGPLRRRRWRLRSASPHRHRSPTPANPHGHGFVAATRMNRVGRTSACWLRTIVTQPSSSGCLSASSAGRTNSESSSRNSTPRWASVASPGRGVGPPPTRPGAEIV